MDDAPCPKVTGREAAWLLRDSLPVREHARLVLAAGFAGAPMRTSASLLYDVEAVRELAGRRTVGDEELRANCPHGLYVARLNRTSRWDVASPWPDLAAAVSAQPAVTPITSALLAARVAAYGRLPWVATLCGYVAICADCVRVHVSEDGRLEVVLEPPGSWATVVGGRRLPTQRGRPGALLLPGEAGVSARGGA